MNNEERMKKFNNIVRLATDSILGPFNKIKEMEIFNENLAVRPWPEAKEYFDKIRNTAIVWSWGADNFRIISKSKEDNTYYAVLFAVKGALYQGRVLVCVNGLDLFNIYFLTSKREILDKIEDIYLEDLLNKLDEKIEAGIP